MVDLGQLHFRPLRGLPRRLIGLDYPLQAISLRQQLQASLGSPKTMACPNPRPFVSHDLRQHGHAHPMLDANEKMVAPRVRLVHASGLILTFASRYHDSASANVKIVKSTRIKLMLVVLKILIFAPALAA